MKTPDVIYPLLALFLLSACSANKTEYEGLYSSADSVSVSGMTGDSVKMVKTADMNLKVNDVYHSCLLISRKAHDLGGIVMHHNIESVSEKDKRMQLSADSVLVVSAYTTRADMMVRVPAEQLEEFMNGVSSLAGFVRHSRLDIEDKSFDYLASSMKKQNHQSLLKEAEKKTAKSKEVTDLIGKSDEVVDREINNRRINADVKYSTVLLALSQHPAVRKEIVANDNLASYDLPFVHRISNAVFAGWQFFISFVVIIAHLWMFILTAVLVWLGIRFYRIKHKVVPGETQTALE